MLFVCFCYVVEGQYYTSVLCYTRTVYTDMRRLTTGVRSDKCVVR